MANRMRNLNAVPFQPVVFANKDRHRLIKMEDVVEACFLGTFPLKWMIWVEGKYTTFHPAFWFWSIGQCSPYMKKSSSKPCCDFRADALKNISATKHLLLHECYLHEVAHVVMMQKEDFGKRRSGRPPNLQKAFHAWNTLLTSPEDTSGAINHFHAQTPHSNDFPCTANTVVRCLPGGWYQGWGLNI